MDVIYIGVDGGATHSTAAAYRPENGRLARIAVCEGEGLNYLNDGIDTCAARLGDMVRRLKETCGAANAYVCAGLAALDRTGDTEVTALFMRKLPEGCSLLLESDAHIALCAHAGTDSGMVIICGTGSMLSARDREGNRFLSGGWGWKFGDALSGYTLAQKGLQYAMDAYDAADPDGKALTEAALAFFGAPDMRALIDVLYAPESPVHRIAAFGREVIRLARENDAAAIGIVTEETDNMARKAADLHTRVPDACETGLYGGVFTKNPFIARMLAEKIRALAPDMRVSLLRNPPEYGAALCAFRRFKEE